MPNILNSDWLMEKLGKGRNGFLFDGVNDKLTPPFAGQVIHAFAQKTRDEEQRAK